MNVKSNLQSLGASVNIHTNSNWKNITKTRFNDVKTNHMFMRQDCNATNYKKARIKNINFDKYDAVVISDYNKGFLKEEDIEFICSKHDCTFLDTKKILGDWCKNIKFIKINIYEYNRTKKFIDNELEEKMIITMGSEGCKYNGIIYSVPEVEITDVSGAGDTFVAGLCYEYVRTKDIDASIIYANHCATKVVQKRGVSTV